MYSEEEIDKMIEAHTDFIAGNLVSEISNFLEAN